MNGSRSFVRWVAAGAVAAVLATAAGQARAATEQVVLTRGESVHLVFVEDALTFPASSASFANAISMALQERPTVRGFPVELDVVEAICGDGDAAARAASVVTAAPENVAVLGHLCSAGFERALPLYEAAHVLTISGSASNDALPAYAPTVFDRTIVADGAGGAEWYARVAALPSDVEWQEAYAAEFGLAPLPFADLYYDAATLLLRNLQRVAYLDGGGWLVIDRRALAAAVRATTRLRGVSCEISLAPQSGDRVNDADALDRCDG